MSTEEVSASFAKKRPTSLIGETVKIKTNKKGQPKKATIVGVDKSKGSKKCILLASKGGFNNHYNPKIALAKATKAKGRYSGWKLNSILKHLGMKSNTGATGHVMWADPNDIEVVSTSNVNMGSTKSSNSKVQRKGSRKKTESSFGDNINKTMKVNISGAGTRGTRNRKVITRKLDLTPGEKVNSIELNENGQIEIKTETNR